MKKLLLFLTLLSASHIAYGAEQQVLNQNYLNLWYSIVDPSQCNPQNMNPQEALDACEKNDNSFYFDLFIEKICNSETQDTLLHIAILNENLKSVEWIFNNISETIIYVLLNKQNKNRITPFEIAVEKNNVMIINYILDNIDEFNRFALLSTALKKQNNAVAKLIINHESFNSNLSLLFNPNQKSFNMVSLSQHIQLIVTNDKNNFKNGLILLIKSNKCTKERLAIILLTLLKKIYKHQKSLTQGILKSISTDDYHDLIDAITTNEKFDKDETLNYFIHFNHDIWKDDLPAIEWLFKTSPEHQFADNSYINYIVSKNKDLTPQHLAIIQLLVDHKITSISPQHYDTLKAHQFVTDNSADDQKYLSLNNDKSKKNKDSTTSSPQRPAIIPFPLSTQHYDTLNAHQSVTDNSEDDSKYYSLNDDKSKVAQLTINSWTPQRSFGLKAISIAAVLYDFIRFKKPEKITDVKKDIKAKITDKSGTKKDTKKADIKHDTKESKEKKELSRWNRLVKHTRNYKKDLLKNPRNHKKLAIPFACLLIRALKDKTPLKGY